MFQGFLSNLAVSHGPKVNAPLREEGQEKQNYPDKREWNSGRLRVFLSRFVPAALVHRAVALKMRPVGG